MSLPGRRLLWIVLGLVALVAVAVVAFGIGVHSGSTGGPVFYRRGFGPGMMGWGADGGWFGWIPVLLLVFVGIFLVVLFLSGDRPYRPGGPAAPGMPGSGPGPFPPVNDVDRLRQLSELHERGQLTDEEFAAAKRKLLGL